MGNSRRAKNKKKITKHQSGDDIASDRRRVLIYLVDLHGLTWEEAQSRLRAAHREAAHKGSRLLKIIHGYGKNTGSNVLQVAVRGWLARNPFPFRAAIPGEAYTLTDPTTSLLRSEIGEYPDNDLNATNQGMTLVWLK